MSEEKNYLDIEDALKRVGGNEALYKKLLIIFLDDNNAQQLCNAVEIGNNEAAAQLAHTIKGVSANLSLIKLRTLAADIESRVKSGLDAKELLPEFMTTFEKTSELIKDYLD